MDELKICSKCDIEKELTEFRFRKDTQKFRKQCRESIKSINKEYQTINKDEIKIQRKKYRERTKNWKRIYDIYYRECNRDNIQLYKKSFFQNNKQELYKKIKKRKDEDSNFRLDCNIRKRVLNAFKARNVRKANKIFYLLGSSHSFLRPWIESHLDGEITIEKYGKVWCSDHCLPKASVNLLDENDIKKCLNWVNLRPMYVRDKIFKGDKIDMRLYLLQEKKGNYFMKSNDQEG